MRKFLLTFLFIVTSTTLIAQDNTTRFFHAFNHETLTLSSTALGFTPSKYNPGLGQVGASLAIITVECSSGSSCPSRFTLDGTTATTTVGQTIDYQYILSVYGFDNITRFSAIQSGSTAAVFQVVYYR